MYSPGTPHPTQATSAQPMQHIGEWAALATGAAALQDARLSGSFTAVRCIVVDAGDDSVLYLHLSLPPHTHMRPYIYHVVRTKREYVRCMCNIVCSRFTRTLPSFPFFLVVPSHSILWMPSHSIVHAQTSSPGMQHSNETDYKAALAAVDATLPAPLPDVLPPQAPARTAPMVPPPAHVRTQPRRPKTPPSGGVVVRCGNCLSGIGWGAFFLSSILIGAVCFPFASDGVVRLQSTRVSISTCEHVCAVQCSCDHHINCAAGLSRRKAPTKGTCFGHRWHARCLAAAAQAAVQTAAPQAAPQAAHPATLVALKAPLVPVLRWAPCLDVLPVNNASQTHHKHITRCVQPFPVSSLTHKPHPSHQIMLHVISPLAVSIRPMFTVHTTHVAGPAPPSAPAGPSRSRGPPTEPCLGRRPPSPAQQCPSGCRAARSAHNR